MTKIKDKIKEPEGAEYGVDSRYTSKKERLADGIALMEDRLKRMENVSEEQIIKAKLLQVKFKMEEYIKNPVCQDPNFFTKILNSYIDTIYSRESDFAKDIDITPVRLSQVLNNHREPGDEFIMRLMIHSEKTFKNIGEFHKESWYQVYFQDKICKTMSSQNEWRPETEKHVNINELAWVK